MSIEAYMWTSFSIPEMDGRPFVTASTLEKIDQILREEGLGPTYHRQDSWLFFRFAYPTIESRRLVLQAQIQKLLVDDLTDVAGRLRGTQVRNQPLVFWKGAVTRIYQARATNEDITE